MKLIIITGASKGIGNAIAKEFYKNGYAVISLSRTKATNLNGIEQIEFDLTDLVSLQAVFKSVLNKNYLHYI